MSGFFLLKRSQTFLRNFIREVRPAPCVVCFQGLYSVSDSFTVRTLLFAIEYFVYSYLTVVV